MAFYLLIGARLDNKVCLSTQPSTFCCLLDEEGEKTVMALQAAEKLSMSVNIPRACCPEAEVATRSLPSLPSFDDGVTAVLQIPKSTLTPSPGVAELWLEAEHSHPRL